jgi:parallel beta-helix repeat protein
MKSDRKLLTLLLLALLSVACFTLISTSIAQSTIEKGVISSDTTWTKATSPHNLAGNVLVKEGVTLTIEAGATVNLKTYYILVNGTLQARGTSSDRIVINGIDGSPPQTPLGSSLALPFTYGIAINGNGAIENALINKVRLALGNSNRISNSTISGFISVGPSSYFTNNSVNGIINAGQDSKILNNRIGGGIQTLVSPTISNNIISGGTGIWCYLSFNIVISDNIITNCDQGIFAQGGNGVISKNFIADNTNGITVNYGSTVAIKDNSIEENHIGIKVPSSASPIITNNNFQHNSYNIYLEASGNIDATNNWWGTTDTNAINQTIYDSKDDFNLGTVTFVPFLTSSNSQAPIGPIPTPSPTVTPSTSPSPSPTVPEFPVQAFLLLFVIVPLIAVAVIKRSSGLDG